MPSSRAPSRDGEADDDFSSMFGRGSGASAAPAAAPAESMSRAAGKGAVAISRATKKMKEEERGPSAEQPVRVASGRTFVFRDGGWIDSEVLTSPGQQLEVKFLSKAYFALLQARPDLKAALALGERVVVQVARGKSVIIGPRGTEEPEKVTAFLK